MIHLKAEFLSSCEPVKPNKFGGSKILWWDKPRDRPSHYKREMLGRRKGLKGPKEI